MTNQNSIKQQTIQTSINTSGIGIHSGKKINLTLRPAPIDTGIVFCRTDLNPTVEILACTKNIGDTTLSSCLVKNDVRISTIEHMMSAFAGLQIDNAYVDVDAQEIPIMDGSAEPLVRLIEQAGILEQNANKKFIRIKKTVEVKQGDKYVKLEPYDGFKISLLIDYDHPLFQNNVQQATLDFTEISYTKDISRARTFGFLAEFDQLRAANLALGCSLDNVLALDKNGIVNEGGLRYKDEFVRHKILDAIGDLYLLEHSLIGSFIGYKPGHTLNHQLCQTLLADKTAWEIIQ